MLVKLPLTSWSKIKFTGLFTHLLRSWKLSQFFLEYPVFSINHINVKTNAKLGFKTTVKTMYRKTHRPNTFQKSFSNSKMQLFFLSENFQQHRYTKEKLLNNKLSYHKRNSQVNRLSNLSGLIKTVWWYFEKLVLEIFFLWLL